MNLQMQLDNVTSYMDEHEENMHDLKYHTRYHDTHAIQLYLQELFKPSLPYKCHENHLCRYYENRTGERFSAVDGRLNSMSMDIDTVASSVNATVNHVQSMYRYINVESSSCQGRMGRHTEDLQVGMTKEFLFELEHTLLSLCRTL